MSKDRKTHFDFIQNVTGRLSTSEIPKTPLKIGKSQKFYRDSDHHFLSNSPTRKLDNSYKST
jgi:hypothetical protein